ncbi:MAG: hypothetical protein KDC92_05240, partial [Bacteroidetes bacterium]|nr:hypothetical protein [Bacteroidota bacterium]
TGKRETVCRRLGIETSKKVAILASSNIEHEHISRETLKIFCTAMELLKSDGWTGIIKLHPVEKKSNFEPLINQYSNVILAEKEVLGVDDSLLIAECCCFYSTAFAFEALMNQVPLVVINPDERYLGESRLLIEMGGVPQARNAETLQHLFLHRKKDDLLSSQKELSTQYCSHTGHKAALNIVNQIECLLSDNSVLN